MIGNALIAFAALAGAAVRAARHSGRGRPAGAGSPRSARCGSPSRWSRSTRCWRPASSRFPPTRSASCARSTASPTSRRATSSPPAARPAIRPTSSRPARSASRSSSTCSTGSTSLPVVVVPNGFYGRIVANDGEPLRGRPDHGRRLARRRTAEISRRRIFHDPRRPEGAATRRS